MAKAIRWAIYDRYDNEIYLTQERWEHIIEDINHPEMSGYEDHLKETIQSGQQGKENDRGNL